MNDRERKALEALDSISESKGSSMRYEKKADKESVSIHEQLETMSQEELENLERKVKAMKERKIGEHQMKQEEKQSRESQVLDSLNF